MKIKLEVELSKEEIEAIRYDQGKFGEEEPIEDYLDLRLNQMIDNYVDDMKVENEIK